MGSRHEEVGGFPSERMNDPPLHPEMLNDADTVDDGITQGDSVGLLTNAQADLKARANGAGGSEDQGIRGGLACPHCRCLDAHAKLDRPGKSLGNVDAGRENNGGGDRRALDGPGRDNSHGGAEAVE